MNGSHHHWVSFRSFNIHTVPSPRLLSMSLKGLRHSGKEIRPQFVAMVIFYSGTSWGRIWKWVQFHWVTGGNTMIMYFCMLLAYNQLVSFPSCPFQPPSGVILFISRILWSCCLFISHCFQAWTALFWGVPYVSAECRWMAPARLQAPPETSTVTRRFFFLPPLLEASGVMKTKYTHLLLLSVSYPTLTFSSLNTRSFFLSFTFCFPDTLANGSCSCARRLSGETSNKQSK